MLQDTKIGLPDEPILLDGYYLDEQKELENLPSYAVIK